MPSIGVLGGMGPAASVDFVNKIIKLTPASCDQEHLPLILANLPHVYDRSNAILGIGRDPLPQLLAGIDVLNSIGVGVVVIPCNSSHHWFDEMCAHSNAPILHIANASVDAIADGADLQIALFATRGALASGFYQREMKRRGISLFLLDVESEQQHIDSCIREIKAGNFQAGGQHLSTACRLVATRGATSLIMGCTEIPIASQYADVAGLVLIDSSLELARATVDFAIVRGWNNPGWYG